MPQASDFPTVMALKVRFPVTATGMPLFALPLPSDPLTPRPQQYAAPVVAMPQYDTPPPDRLLNFRVVVTGAGVGRTVVKKPMTSSPSCPTFCHPQQCAV